MRRRKRRKMTEKGVGILTIVRRLHARKLAKKVHNRQVADRTVGCVLKPFLTFEPPSKGQIGRNPK
jgi:hypothetical protein